MDYQRNLGDLQRAVVCVLRDSKGVVEKDKLWNMTSRYYGKTPAATDFGVRRMSDVFEDMRSIIHFDPTGTLVLLGSEPYPRQDSTAVSGWSAQATSGTDEFNSVKQNCIKLLRERKRLKRSGFWTVYNQRFKESPSPRRMGLENLEQFLGLCEEFMMDSHYIMLRDSGSSVRRTEQNLEQQNMPTLLEQVINHCVALLQEHKGRLERKKFWMLFTQRFRYSPSTKDLGVNKLEDVFVKYSRFEVRNDKVYLKERERSRNPSQSSDQSTGTKKPQQKAPLKPLWGEGAQAASSLSGSRIYLDSSSPDSDSDSDDVRSQPRLNASSRSSSIRSLGPEQDRGERTRSADQTGFLSLEVGHQLQRQQIDQQQLQRQQLEQQQLPRQQLEQYQLQKQQFQQQQQQLLQMQQQLLGGQVLQPQGQWQPLKPQLFTAAATGPGSDSTPSTSQPASSAASGVPPPPLLPQEPTWPPATERLGIPPGRPRERKDVVAKPISFVRGRLTKEQLEAVAQDCLEMLVEAGDYVAPERIARLLLQRYGVGNLHDLGVPSVRLPYQIECINQHQRLLCKVNASIEAFVNARSMCTLYELQESLREYATDNGPFESLQLGPLQCLPDVYKLFKFPQDEMIPEITTSELLEVLSEYLSKHQKWTAKLEMEEVMAFFVEHYEVKSAYSLGIRIRSLPLAAQVLKKSHRDAAATRRSIVTQFKSNIEEEVKTAFKKVKVTILQTADDGTLEVRKHYAQITAEAVLMELMQKFRILLSIDEPHSKAEHKRHNTLDTVVRQFLTVMQGEPLGRALLHLAICVGSHDIQEAESMLSATRQAGAADSESSGGGGGPNEKPKAKQPPSKVALMDKLKKYVERCLYQGTLTLTHLDRIEEKLLEDFNFPTFVSMGFGRFLHFLLHDPEPKALLEECGGISLGSSSASAGKVHMTEVLEFVRQCHAAGVSQEVDIERALCHQFQVPEVKVLGFGNVRHLMKAAESPGKHHSKDYRILYETAVSGRTSEPVRGRREVGVLGSQSKEAALACLQSCPLLEELGKWSHWSLVFEPQHGSLKDFLQKYGGVYTLSMEGQKTVTTDIIAMEVEPGQLLRLVSTTSPAHYEAAVSRGDAREACGHLASLVAGNRGLEHTPLALLANHTRTALFALHTASMAGGPGGPGQPTSLTDPAIQFVLSCLLLLPHRLCVAVANQIFLEPLAHVVGSSRSKTLVLEACRGQAGVNTTSLPDTPQGRQQMMELALLGCMLGIQEWTQPLTSTFVFPPEVVTMVMPQQSVVRDELLGDDDEAVEEEESESESEEEESSASFLSDEEEETQLPEGGQVKNEASAAKLAGDEDEESSGETNDSSDDEEGDDEDEEEAMVEREDADGMKETVTVANASDEEGASENELETEREKTETEEDKCQRLINEIRREEFGVGVELNEDGKRLMKVQQERLGRSLDRLSRDLYTKDTHFVLELVQNADDNSYPEHLMESLAAGSDREECPSVQFVIEEAGVMVLNNECGFREKDVRALCDVGRSTKGKHKYGYIGQKGIGFKSVFRVTSRPEVHSNGFHLCFDVSSGPMGYILPHWCEDTLPQPEWMTKIVLPLKEDMASEVRSLAARFNDIHPSLLLFLHRLRNIIIDNKVEGSSLNMRRVDLGNNIVEIHHGQSTTDRWLVVKKQLDASNISLQAKSGVEVESTEIALAFPLRSKWRQQHAQVAPAKQPVFAFLPLRSYGFRFIVQGDFDVPSSREDVDRDSSWNQWLRNEIHMLFVEAFDVFRAHPEFTGLESLWAYLQFVPLEDEILEFFKPVATQILQRLRAFPCMPVTTSNTGKKEAIEWKLPSQTVMVQDSLLLEVISPELLQRHLGLHYLHRDAVAMLSPLLARSLGVETITSDHLVQIGRSLASTWGEGAGEGEVIQIAKWLACIYRSMDDFQENNTLISALQAMRVIPLSTGQLVSLNEVTVFFLSDSGLAEKSAVPGKKDPLNMLRQDLQVVHGCLTATPDNEVNSQVVKLLLKVGVKQLSPYDIIHHHILPVLRSDQWQRKDRAVLVSYLVYIKDQRMHDNSLVNMEELKSVARVVTNQGTKNPATDTVHFTPAYGTSFDLQRYLPGLDWVLLDSQYLPHPASRVDVQSWQEFFAELGVTAYLAVKKQEVILKRDEMDNSPWAPMKNSWPALEDSYTICDFVCEEFQQLVSHNTQENTHLQQMKVLFSLLCSTWESQFSRFMTCQLHSCDGKTVLRENIPSSFAIALQSLPWVPGVETTVVRMGDRVQQDEKELLMPPLKLYLPDPHIKRLLAHTVPYLAAQVSTGHSAFTNFLNVKSRVEKETVCEALVSWSKRDPNTPKEAATFCSTLAHLKQVYLHLYESLPPKEAQDLFHNHPVIFVPQVPPGVTFTLQQMVVGRMLGRDEVWWQDTSMLFIKYRSTLLEFRSPLADKDPVQELYRDLQDAFLRTARIQKEPTLADLAELLSLIASALSLKEEGLLTDILKIYAMIGQGLSITFSTNSIEFMQQQEQLKKVTELLRRKKILATKQMTWVSPDDKPMVADNLELEKMFVGKPGVHFLVDQPMSQQKRGVKSKASTTSQVNVDDIKVFLALFSVRLLSEEVVKQEIPEMFTPCAPGQQHLRTVIPFIQCYLMSRYPEVHEAHCEANMVETLRKLLFVKTKKLEVKYSLRSLPEVYEIRPENCVITGSHFYFHEKHITSLLEVNKEVARFFSNGNSECMKDLRTFLMDLQPALEIAEGGSEREVIKVLNSHDVDPLPEEIEPWEVPPPKLPDPPKPPPPPLAPVVEQHPGARAAGGDGDVEGRILKMWPPPAPGEQASKSGDPSKRSGESKPMGASIWPPPKPPEGTQRDRNQALPSNVRVARHRPDSPTGSIHSDTGSAHTHTDSAHAVPGSTYPRGEGGVMADGQRVPHREGGVSAHDHAHADRPHPLDGGSERREGVIAVSNETDVIRQQDILTTGKRKSDEVETSDSKRVAPLERLEMESHMGAEEMQPAGQDVARSGAGGQVTAEGGSDGSVAMATGTGARDPSRKPSGITSRHRYPPFTPRPDQLQLPVWTELACETEYEELGRGGDLQIPTSITLSEASDRTEIGRWGELLVFDYLLKQKEMHSEIYDVIWANDAAESGKPYDFEIVCTTEDEAYSLYIEVKATRSSKKEVFEISSNEVKFASEHGERYHIYRIFSAGNTGQVQLVRLANVIHKMDTKEVRLLMVI